MSVFAALVEHSDEGFGAGPEEIEADERSGRVRGVEVEHGGVGGFVEGVAGIEDLFFAALNLKNDGAPGDQADDGAGMEVQAGLLMRREVDLFDFDAMDFQSFVKEGGEEGLADDR